MKARDAVVTAIVGMGAWGLSSCSPAGFQSETVIDTVRILASRANEPRAKPGDTVTLEVLAYDGRAHKAEKMNVFWLAVPCINPKNDAYFACFSQFGKGAPSGIGMSEVDGGPASDAAMDDAGAPFVAPLEPPLLVAGTKFTFKVPPGVVIPRNGTSPYGLVIVFNFACAGHLELVPFDPSSGDPQQLPVGCFDSKHNQLGADDFVFGFTRVYAESAPDEENPKIGYVDTDAGRLDIDADVTTKPFRAPLCGGDADTCDHHSIGPFVPTSNPPGKQVWADFYATVGTFKSDARLLYGPGVSFSVPGGTDDEYISPSTVTNGSTNYIWIVVHDDKGGANWVTVPLDVK